MEQIRIEQDKGRLTVRLAGDVTFDVASNLRDQVGKALGEADFRVLVVDLTDVGFVDSSGIGTLVSLNSKVYGAGRRFALLRPNERVRKTLELVKLLEFFIVANGRGRIGDQAHRGLVAPGRGVHALPAQTSFRPEFRSPASESPGTFRRQRGPSRPGLRAERGPGPGAGRVGGTARGRRTHPGAEKVPAPGKDLSRRAGHGGRSRRPHAPAGRIQRLRVLRPGRADPGQAGAEHPPRRGLQHRQRGLCRRFGGARRGAFGLSAARGQRAHQGDRGGRQDRGRGRHPVRVGHQGRGRGDPPGHADHQGRLFRERHPGGPGERAHRGLGAAQPHLCRAQTGREGPLYRGEIYCLDYAYIGGQLGGGIGAAPRWWPGTTPCCFMPTRSST